jgi:hypothetical protein
LRVLRWEFLQATICLYLVVILVAAPLQLRQMAGVTALQFLLFSPS